MTLPIAPHPLRDALNAEMHARPPQPLRGEAWVTHIALLHEGASVADEEAHLHALCDSLGAGVCPLVEGDHWMLEAGPLRLKWERHNEFSTYTFYRDRQPDEQAANAVDAFPADWVAGVPGKLLVAAQIEFVDVARCDPGAELAGRGEGETPVVAVDLAGGLARVVSDFRVHDGYTRFRLISRGMSPRQAGRNVQRLLEIETYRLMALLAFPLAKSVWRRLGEAEGELADLMKALGEAGGPEDERALLGRLTRLAAEIETSITDCTFRFGAAEAYYQLVRQRIDDLRETRIDGFPPISEFVVRRLSPAMDTCQSVARRQNELSTRIARKSALLRTRVDIELERQNQQLLEQMNRRSHLQLRLQETVEGLSVVAITYYASQLVHYLAKGAKSLVGGPPPEVVAALSIPVIATAVALGIRRMRKALAAEENAPH